ncbi:MAG: hypothetical protein QOK10_3433 [Pseudonocardiales bacterium]|jgi:hypothetical protein|nr:hypothetical protein [Pseudonocardiales bacterium]
MTRSNADRLWIMGGAVAALLLVALAWFFAVSPELSSASSLKSQTADAQTQNITLQAKIRKLQDDNQKMATIQASLADARKALPVDAGLAAFTRQLVAAGVQNGVTVVSVSASTPILPTAKTGAAAPAAGKSTSAAGQLYAIPVTLTAKGAPANELKFLAALQGTGKRAALIVSTQLSADTTARANGNSIQMSVQLQVFVAPQSPADQAALDKLLSSTPVPAK